MRRFELINGNQAKYWEIARDDDVVITRSAAIGRTAKEKEKEFPDDMAAEVEFDKLIHTKRRQGWLEVETPTESVPEFEERAMELRPLDGSEAETFSGPAMKYLLWRMVEVQLFDRHRAPDDLSRWDYRAYRKLGLEGVPESTDPKYGEWVELQRELSTRDRAAKMRDHLIGAFKYRSGSHWIVTPAECSYIAGEGANRRPKRAKEKAEQTQWVAKWCAFHARAMKVGYEAVPV